MIVGVAVLLRQQGRLLFDVQKPEGWTHTPGGGVIIGIGCIGGRIEPGESTLEALQREALEEIGCTILLDRPAEPFSVGADGAVRTHQPEEVPEGVLFFWEGSGHGFIEGGQVAVFSGRPAGPLNLGDIPAVIGMSREVLMECGAQSLTVEDVLARGGTIEERQAVPRHVRLLPVMTAGVVAALPEEFRLVVLCHLERI
ncbi:MAG: NUDIX domain-containing protein [Armatimonadetes bacterium]|nr:NUDIX domain-containing protein [Armatimonadota bacterium]